MYRYPNVGWGWSDITHALNPMTHFNAAKTVLSNPFNPLKQTQAALNIFRKPGAASQPPPGYGPPPGYDPNAYQPPAGPSPAPPGYPPAPAWASQLPGYNMRAGQPPPAAQYDWSQYQQTAAPIYDWSQYTGQTADYGAQPTGWAAAYGS